MQYLLPKLTDIIKNLNNNFSVIDLCCGNGWAGQEFLKHGFKNVTLVDARTEWFDSYFNKSLPGWTFYQLDINEQERLLEIISKIDIICYLGHLYHTSNPELMLEILCNTGCKHLLLETKTLLENSHPYSKPEIHWDLEPTNLHGLAYSTDKQEVLVGRPNLRWTIEKLQTLGYTVISKETMYINQVSYSNPKQIVGQHFIHAIPSSTFNMG